MKKFWGRGVGNLCWLGGGGDYSNPISKWLLSSSFYTNLWYYSTGRICDGMDCCGI